MIINLSVHFTNKCNYKCEHCMFSCDNNVREDRNEVLNLAKEIKNFLNGYTYRLNLYGGESFLDILLIKEYINKLIDDNCIYFGIPTNGYFLDNEKLLVQIDSLFEGKNTKEKSKIIISTSEYHQKQWSEGVKNVVDNIHLLNKYKNIYNLIEIQNTFMTQGLIPYGRAKELNLKCIDRRVRCDLFEYDADHLEICINQNGDVSFCDFGYTIGNIRNLSIEKIIDIKNKSYNKNKNKIFKNISNVCEKCKKGRYVYVKL